MPYYAELDQNNIVMTVCELTSDNMASSTIISIATMDITLLGQQYDSGSNTFAPVQ